ncbi:T9SS type A sorting domain-containing protein [Winogradskyella sp.]|uniref:T9SS type A sorting domain-containing protein n=1 Tax=Winogradskyella sp. TaxID=1883156 RepID=UPI0026294E9A|nr:T9SS type A sorting domain-containing protein [Winogradskyella sp.]
MKKLCLIFLLVPLLGFTQVQIGENINGGLQFEQLGRSISLSSDGNILAVGADGANDTFSNSGIVRVYENINGTWAQIGNDIVGNQFEVLSYSVSLSSDGSIVAVGAGDLVDRKGLVRIFENINGIWTQIGNDILGMFDDDLFGRSISLSSDGNIVAVGASWHGGFSGEVRVFENINNDWTQVGQDINGDTPFEELGRSVSLSSDGSKLAIGAPRNNDNVFASGQVKIFENQSNNWVQIGQDLNGENIGDGFGTMISLSSDGNTVAIAATGDDDSENNSGKVSVYENISGVWTQIGDGINGEEEDDFLGRIAISSDGSIVAISTDRNNNFAGHVRVFKNISDVWTQIGQDISGNSSDQLGYSVALSSDGSVVATGAYTASTINGSGSGYAAVYDLNAVLSTEDQTISNFSIYPNPTKDQFTIQLDNRSELQNVNIYNNFGQLVLTSKVINVDISKLTSGLYMVEIVTAKSKGTKKLIIG